MKSIDKFIKLVREQMVANAPGGSGGFSGSADPKGPTAGFDPVMKFMKRGKVDNRKVPKNYKKWVNSIKNK